MWKKLNSRLQELQNTFVLELIDSLKDAGTVLIFIIAVIAYPVLYSIGYMNETLKDVPVAVVDLDHSMLSRQYSRMIDATEQLKIKVKPGSLKEAKQMYYEGNIQGIFLIPQDFEKNILNHKQTQVVVYCDASRFLVYKQVISGANSSDGYFSGGIEYRNLLSEEKMPEQAIEQTDPLQVQIFNLFNPNSGYATFIVPGILLIVIQQSLLVGIGLLTGKRFERRKKNNILSEIHTEGHVIPTILGRAFAYVFLYLFTSLFLLGILYKWLSFPDRGSFITIYFLLIPYLLTIAFAGLSLSFLFRKRVNALMFIVFLSPTVFFFSGISWPLQSMPLLIKILSYIFPSTFMIPAFVKLRIIGGGVDSINYEWVLLLIQMVVYFLLACIALKVDQKKQMKENLSV
ncbi:MAG: ABC transporter permease [Bacteroidales bacterium]|jgi:ABC-2 type transport system permease protein